MERERNSSNPTRSIFINLVKYSIELNLILTNVTNPVAMPIELY
jgi:hypothetical protein